MTRHLSDAELLLWHKVMSGSEIIESPIASTISRPLPIVVRDHNFKSRLDLHGLTIMEAYTSVMNHIDRAIENNHKKITVITGKSGKICEEFPEWIKNSKNVKRYELKNNKGSWTIWPKMNTI